jgi:outer membrane protein TolC
MKALRLIIKCFYFLSLGAQNQKFKVLSFHDFMNLVAKNHPMVKQAYHLSDMSRAELLSARYHFDPKLDYDFTRKKFDGKRYYEYLDYGLKIPTWTGIDLKAGYQQNSGQFINPFDFTPPGGLAYAGVETSLERLFFDERRNTVRQAKIMAQIADNEKVKIINKTLLSAAKMYWEWYFQYNRLKAFERNYVLAKERYTGLVDRLVQGDVASIDTLEAALNADERYIDYQNALNDYQTAKFSLSNFLWTEDMIPLELDDNAIPETLIIPNIESDTVLTSLLEKAQRKNPEILKAKLKINQAFFEKKFRTNDIIPHIGLSLKFYTVPNNNQVDFSRIDQNYLGNNYKIQISFAQSLFFRKEIGKYRQSQLKYKIARLDYTITKLQVANEIKSYHNDLFTYIDLFKIQQNNLKRSDDLYKAEKFKFEIGESSLFLLFSRESKRLDAEVKLHSIYAKFQKAKIELGNSVGEIVW